MLEAFQQYQADSTPSNRKKYEISLYVLNDVTTEHLAQQIMLIHSMPAFRKDFIDKYAKKLSLPELTQNVVLPQQLRTFQKDTPWPTGRVDEKWLKQQLRKSFLKDFIDEDSALLSIAERHRHIRALVEQEQAALEAIHRRQSESQWSSSSTAHTKDFEIEDPEKFAAPTLKQRRETRASASHSSEEHTAPEIASAPPLLTEETRMSDLNGFDKGCSSVDFAEVKAIG
ncbi:hypothetical protein B0A48_18557 [Cryoendolithus antarcticus]|uniref:Uncharacterized protein n=1 Tax=Cryoendolithus antarcticus TaxID=1507870 RepID=A0A1V8S944_9PEZI|nr:hypothetical protein B0A48_18557 [Cryoendolithus antarcticus]